jgi:hypothetical protein
MSKEVKQEEVKRIEVTGTCKYCRQQVFFKMPENATPEEIETEATRSCKCEQGESARMIMDNQATADKWIDLTYANEETMRGVMHNLANAVIWSAISQGVIKQVEGVDYTTTKVTSTSMKRGNDGKLVITQNITFKKKEKI